MAEKGYQVGPVLADRLISVVKRVEAMPYQMSRTAIETRFEEMPTVGGGGKLRIGKVSSDWAFGECATVTIWEGEAGSGSGSGQSCKPTETSPAETIGEVRNLSHDVASGSWVTISKAADGNWYLVEAGSPDNGSCRKTIAGEDYTQWPGWNTTKVQLLGHDENGCLKWFDNDDCEETTGP